MLIHWPPAQEGPDARLQKEQAPRGFRNVQFIYSGGDHSLGEITGRSVSRNFSSSQALGIYTLLSLSLPGNLSHRLLCNLLKFCPAALVLRASRSRHPSLLCFIPPCSKCRLSKTDPLGPSCVLPNPGAFIPSLPTNKVEHDQDSWPHTTTECHLCMTDPHPHRFARLNLIPSPSLLLNTPTSWQSGPRGSHLYNTEKLNSNQNSIPRHFTKTSQQFLWGHRKSSL